jgi:ABC-type polysaccharide/polyol phosphate export permease
MNFVMLLMWVFSGVFFVLERFPAAFQPFIQILPLTAVFRPYAPTCSKGTPHRTRPETAIIVSWFVFSFSFRARLPLAVGYSCRLRPN